MCQVESNILKEGPGAETSPGVSNCWTNIKEFQKGSVYKWGSRGYKYVSNDNNHRDKNKALILKSLKKQDNDI